MFPPEVTPPGVRATKRSTRKETVMTTTGVPQVDRLLHLDDDDFDEPGTFGLHLGVLRRFLLIPPREQSPTSPTVAASER
jgi:hypothetical protein